MADIREAKYEALGIGSSYFFRVNDYEVTDATMTGNLARCVCNCDGSLTGLRVSRLGSVITYPSWGDQTLKTSEGGWGWGWGWGKDSRIVWILWHENQKPGWLPRRRRPRAVPAGTT